jgi:hypothetical protein
VKLSLGGRAYDPSDPVGRLLYNVLGMVAEFESDLIRRSTLKTELGASPKTQELLVETGPRHLLRLTLHAGFGCGWLKWESPRHVCVGGSRPEWCSGGDLLSHTLPGAVPSALWVLASGFGMGPGVSPTL